MKAMILNQITSLDANNEPLTAVEVPIPEPGTGEILIQVSVCGVCHTELDEIEGRTAPPQLPVIPGHQVVGSVFQNGPEATKFQIGDRVGVAWIFSACGRCDFCQAGLENLCPSFKATGRDVNGGYADFIVVPENFVFPLPVGISDQQAAPLLCAGAIGYRSLQLTGLQNGQTLGLTGFGASAHLVLQLAKFLFPQSLIFVFARSESERLYALSLGATWAGNIQDNPPTPLNAIIDSTPAWLPIVFALKFLKPSGRLVINAIRKEETDKDVLSQLDYPQMLWLEKEIKSVANITRQDVINFLDLAARIPITPEIQLYSLAQANLALQELKRGKIRGAKVLVVQE